MKNETNNILFKKIKKKKSLFKKSFPLLNSSPNKKNTHKRKVQKSGSLTFREKSKLFYSLNETFLKRNYNKYFDKMQKNNFHENVLSEKDLNTLLYKLKQNYNLITTIIQKRDLEIDKLNTNLETTQVKLKKIIDFQEIELPEEKISLKKIGDTKMTIEELEKYLKDLVEEKRKLDYKVYINNQYSKTVQYMLDEEKRKLLNIQEETNQIQEKLNNFQRYHKAINDNIIKTKLKISNFNELDQKLQNDINLATKIIITNNEKNEKLQNRINSKEQKMDNLKQRILSLKTRSKEELKKYKENIYDKIQKSKEDEKERNKKEKRYIKIIYCLFLLQKYFINEKIFDYEKLKLSREYKLINNDFDSNDNNNCLKLEEIKKIFNEINMKKETIIDYISKLSSKILFNKNYLSRFHQKEMLLNEKKVKYYSKINKMINDDYLKFEQLTKSSPKFKSLVDKNEYIISNISNRNKKGILNEIKIQLYINKTDTQNKDNKNKEQILKNANEIYKKSNQLILMHNNFIDNMVNTIKNIIITIQSANNNEKEKNYNNNNIYLKNKKEDYNFIKLLNENYEKLINFQKLSQKKVFNSSKFVNYIKELIEYNKNILKEKISEKILKNDLLYLFYKDVEKEVVDESFYNEFDSNNIQNQDVIFYFYYSLSNKFINIIKSLSNFNKKNEKIIENYISKNSNISSMKNLSLSKNNFSKTYFNNFNSYDSGSNFLTKSQVGVTSQISKQIKRGRRSISQKIKDNDTNSGLVEDKDTSIETESVKREAKIFKRKINKIERQIVNNLYKPTLDKNNYLRELNNNIKNIKNMTLNSSKINFIMKQKKNEIDLMGEQMLLYNNPKLHPDELSKPIYSKINKLMINKRLSNLNYINNREEKRFRSTFINNKYKFKI